MDRVDDMDSTDGGGGRDDFRALARELYEALNGIEWFEWREGHGRCEDYCPRCFADKSDGHWDKCETRNAQNKAEAFFARLEGERETRVLVSGGHEIVESDSEDMSDASVCLREIDAETGARIYKPTKRFISMSPYEK